MLLTLLFISLAFSVTMSLDFPCKAHAFLRERLSNHCGVLRRIFFEIWTNFNAVPLWDPLRNLIRPDTRLQIKGNKKSECPHSCMKFCKLAPSTIINTVASRYYNCCTSPGIYEYLLVQLSCVLGWGTMLQARRSWVRFPMRAFDFSIDLIIPAAVWHGVDSASNRKECQEHFWG
jgi:hypothetical protein